MADAPDTFADRLRAARLAARMTFRVLAEGTGLSVAYLHDLEMHRRPAPSKRVCSLLAETIADWSDMRLRHRNELHLALRTLARREAMDRAAAKWEGDDV